MVTQTEAVEQSARGTVDPAETPDSCVQLIRQVLRNHGGIAEARSCRPDGMVGDPRR
jgi:hypothetical protein